MYAGPGVYPGGPMQGPQQNANGYPQQSGPMQSSPTPAPPQQTQVLFRPVSSYDEALLVPADVTGAITLMPHLSNGLIYTKQLDSNCNVDFGIYRRLSNQPAPVPAPAPASAYDPRTEIAALRDEVNSLRAELEESKKAAPKRPTGGKAVET